jgi:hypothetical protein
MFCSKMSNASEPWEVEDSENHSESDGRRERILGSLDVITRGGGKGDEGGGFLSNGLFGSYSEVGFSGKEWFPLHTADESNEATTDSGSRPFLSSYKSYRNTYHGGGLNWMAEGGFPISCVPKQTGGISGTQSHHSASDDESETPYLYNYAKGNGKGKGKGKSLNESKARSSNSKSKSGKTSKNGKEKGKGSKSQNKDSSFFADEPEQERSSGWLSRAQYFRNVGRTKQHPNGGARGSYWDKRRGRHAERTDVSGWECYFGAFPPFSGIPAMLPTKQPKPQPTILPSQGPTGEPSLSLLPSSKVTNFPTQQTAAPNPPRTASPTLTPTILPTRQTLQPIPATAPPSQAITPPLDVTSAPTNSTAAPTGATLAPTATTNAPTSAPTGATAAPTVAATSATSAPTVQVLSRTLKSELSYGTLRQQEKGRKE